MTRKTSARKTSAKKTSFASAITTALLATIGLLISVGCGEKRLSGKRIDVQGFESAQRSKSSSSNIVLPAPASAEESYQDWQQEQFSTLHLPPPLAKPFAWKKRFLIATGKGRTRAQPLQATPIVAKGRLFALNGASVVSAFDATTGRKAWRRDLKSDAIKRFRNDWDKGLGKGLGKGFGRGFGGGLAFTDGRVFVSTGLGILAALSGETGELLWLQQLPFPLRSAPTLAAEKEKALLLVSTPTYRTYAFTLDGDMLWQQQATSDALAQLTLAPSPGVAGRYAVVGYGDGSLVALDRDNGRVLWQAFATARRRFDALSDIADITTPPVIDGGLVYASSFSGKTVALDLASGSLKWSTPLATLNPLALYGTTLFVVDQNSLLSALDANNGKILWERQLTARFGRKKRKPVLWNGPLLAGEQLILTASNGEIVTIDARNGTLDRQMRFAARFTAPPIAAQGLFFFLDSQGNIHAFE